jgi:hypothetical protein
LRVAPVAPVARVDCAARVDCVDRVDCAARRAWLGLPGPLAPQGLPE